MKDLYLLKNVSCFKQNTSRSNPLSCDELVYADADDDADLQCYSLILLSRLTRGIAGSELQTIGSRDAGLISNGAN